VEFKVNKFKFIVIILRSVYVTHAELERAFHTGHGFTESMKTHKDTIIDQRTQIVQLVAFIFLIGAEIEGRSLVIFQNEVQYGCRYTRLLDTTLTGIECTPYIIIFLISSFDFPADLVFVLVAAPVLPIRTH
jgi:hypothetical protein